MANPQKENGYVPIANEIMDALVRFRIPGECRQVLDVIFRKTYGFNKKEDAIANSQFVEFTGMKKGNVSRSLSKLITNKLVIRSDNTSKDGSILKINKDYQAWIPFVIRSDNKPKKKKVLSEVKPKLSKQITKVIRSDNKVLSEVMDTKDIKTSKDIIQKTGDEVGQARLVRDIIEAFGEINPACKKMYGNTSQRKACLDLVETYTFERVMIVITKTLPKTNNLAFFPTITTPHQLFESWTRLEAAVMKYKSKENIKKPNFY